MEFFFGVGLKFVVVMVSDIGDLLFFIPAEAPDGAPEGFGVSLYVDVVNYFIPGLRVLMSVFVAYGVS